MEMHYCAAMTVAVLANPTAAKGRSAALVPGLLARWKAAGVDVSVLPAASREQALSSAVRAVKDGVDALVAVGGDGTVHLALQAVAGTGTPLGIVPGGTGNDFATCLALGDPLDAFLAGTVRAVDLARVDGAGESVWYGAVLAAGFDAVVNEVANGMRFPKGPQRYNVAIVRELVRLRPRRYVMTLDGERLGFDSVLVAIGNTTSYGGGYRITPAADATDGLLDVVVAQPLSRWTFMRIRPRVRVGTHVEHPLVDSYRARRIELDSPGITAYADGERIMPLPITVTCVPGALTVLG
jgi:diacylglycerol kinase (ATP)